MQIVTVKYATKQGCEALFRERILRHAATSVAREDACQRFDVSVDPDDSSRFFLYEVYVDEAAVHHHHETDHFKAFKADIVPWVVSREAKYYRRISAS